MRSHACVSSVVLSCLALPLAAQVGPPVVNPGNGHSYLLSTTAMTIGPAQALAASIGGHLVAINDAAEDAWIAANFTNVPSTYLWIGLQRAAPGQPFTQWDTGEPLLYTNWCAGEPNGPFAEPFVLSNWCGGGGWNDATGGAWDVFHALVEVGSPSYVTFGSGCPGSLGVTTLTPVAFPRVGSTMTVDLANLPLQSALLAVGLSNTTSALGPLPVDLGPFGMPGCFGRVSADVTVLVSGGDPATFAFAIPANAALAGLQFYHQALVFDPAAGNAVFMVVSDAAAARIGM
jgi:hypothetical protein